jgi:hypothetical protein
VAFLSSAFLHTTRWIEKIDRKKWRDLMMSIVKRAFFDYLLEDLYQKIKGTSIQVETTKTCLCSLVPTSSFELVLW